MRASVIPLTTLSEAQRFYTPPVSASPGRIEHEIMALCASFAYLVEAANQRHQ